MKRLFIVLATIPYVVFADYLNNFYIDAGFGGYNINYYGNSTSSILRVDGGYSINKYVGLQLGLNDFFKTTISDKNGTFNVSGYGYDLSIIPSIPIGENQEANSSLNVFFRLGVGYDSFNSVIENQNDFVDVIGTGLKYNINEHVTTSLQWIGRGLLTNLGNANYNSNSVIASIGWMF